MAKPKAVRKERSKGYRYDKPKVVQCGACQRRLVGDPFAHHMFCKRCWEIKERAVTLSIREPLRRNNKKVDRARPK
jgi:hypothetical protein